MKAAPVTTATAFYWLVPACSSLDSAFRRHRLSGVSRMRLSICIGTVLKHSILALRDRGSRRGAASIQRVSMQPRRMSKFAALSRSGCGSRSRSKSRSRSRSVPTPSPPQRTVQAVQGCPQRLTVPCWYVYAWQSNAVSPPGQARRPCRTIHPKHLRLECAAPVSLRIGATFASTASCHWKLRPHCAIYRRDDSI